MSRDLPLPRAKNQLTETLHKNMPSLLNFIGAGVFSPEQFASAVCVAANEIKSPDSVNPASVVIAAAHAATIGLLPGKAMGLAYFVPRKLRKTDRFLWCNLEVGYSGYLDLAIRNKYLASVFPEIVLEGEDFFCGVRDRRPTIEHTVPPERNLSAQIVRQRLVGAYVIWETTGGSISHHYVPKSKIDLAAKAGGPVWKTDYYPEMVRKTPIRYAAKFWRMTAELAMAVRLDEQAEIGQQQDLGLEIPTQSTDETDVKLSDLPEVADAAEEALALQHDLGEEEEET